MANSNEPLAHIEQQVVLTFKLPGVNWKSHGGVGGSGDQLEHRLDETWTLKVSQDNIRETIRCLQAVVAELMRFAETLER